MIYVGGDSFTAGWPMEEVYGHRNHSWPSLLATQINQTVINSLFVNIHINKY